MPDPEINNIFVYFLPVDISTHSLLFLLKMVFIFNFTENTGIRFHKKEDNSALKRKEILRHATTWMNLEDIVLSDISQSRKDRYYTIPLIGGS